MLKYDNKFFTGLGKLVDCVWLSLLWFICSIPVITMGAASTALYYAVHKSIRGNRGYTTRNFFSAFKDNFKQSTLVHLVWLVVMVVLVGDIYITRAVLLSGSSLGLFFYFFLVLTAVAIGWACYMFPYIARFENTVMATLKNGILLEIRHLPWSLLLIVLMLGFMLLSYMIPLFLFIVPSVVALAFDFILERLFRKYMSKEDLERELENDKIDNMG